MRKPQPADEPSPGGDLESQLGELKKATELAPDNSAAWQNLGVALQNLERYEETMRGGFSLKLSNDPTRPRILVKKASNSATFIQFTVPDGRPPEQRQQERGIDAPPFRGFFVDTTTLANALLGGKWSLKRLAHALTTHHQKCSVDLTGEINEELIGYCLNDVTVTWECFTKLKNRYDSYQLDVPLHRIVSEASVGKAHLAQMRIKPWRRLQPDFPDWVTATLMETYYGGRTECHIRRIPTPGVYVDFLSEYPTVYCLQDLWRFQIAQNIEWEEIDPEEINELLSWIEVEDLLEPEIWRRLHCVVQVEPQGDLLITRARFKPGSPLFNVGLAHLYGIEGWWTLADVIAAKLESPEHRVPKVVRAIRFTPGPIQHGMRPINIAGQADFHIDPIAEDFIQRLIELRAHAKTRHQQTSGAGPSCGMPSSMGSRSPPTATPTGSASKSTPPTMPNPKRRSFTTPTGPQHPSPPSEPRRKDPGSTF